MSDAADPTAAFFAKLRSSGLMQAGHLQELWAWTAASHPDVQGLAKEISRRGWLTPYQIKEIFKGRSRDLVLGPYVFLDLLGEGGMGRVYKAHHTRMSKEVAVKVIRKEKLKHPAAEARFLQEVEALGKMRHPNVVDVFNADQVGEIHYYEMELIDGTDLTHIVRERGPLPFAEACEYIRQAALGLHHAFEKGLVHRDIKPSNLLVTRNTRMVKVVDLGLARLMESEEGNEEQGRITQDGFVIGTPDFLAPEQARNPKGVDIRADIYALGGTLFYVLTGKVPFDGSTPTEKLLKHCTDPPPSLCQYRPDAPAQLDQIIQWCMAKVPEGRPQTPLQLALALQPFCPAVQPVFGGGISGLHAIPAGGVVHAPLPASGAYPQQPARPAYPAPAMPQPVAPSYPAPTPGGYPPQFPKPIDYDPNSSSQLFKIPPQTNSADPIRRRGKGRFPWSSLLLGLGALIISSILGFVVLQMFVKPAEVPMETFTNSLGIKMVKLDGGKFRMGSADLEPGHKPDESPQHEVTLIHPFFVAATEVSNTQYLKVMGTNPSKSSLKAARPQNLPVDNVTWDQANDFCKKLTESEKDQKWMRKGWVYRLPTEAEWEYAARSGTETPFAFGDRIQYEKHALFLPTPDDRLGVGAGKKADSPQLPQEVGITEPNKFGLHDMHGNVAEWCQDWYKGVYHVEGSQENPLGPSDGDKRVVRGGSFRDPATGIRSASRIGARPGRGEETIGFRIVYAQALK